jgi:hypothetical protein
VLPVSAVLRVREDVIAARTVRALLGLPAQMSADSGPLA